MPDSWQTEANNDESNSTQTDITVNNNDENNENAQQFTHKYNTRSSQWIMPSQFNKVYGNQFAVVLTQMSATCGIKQFIQRSINALAAEWKQL